MKELENEAIYNVSEEFREFYSDIINENSVHVDEATFPRMTASMAWDYRQKEVDYLNKIIDSQHKDIEELSAEVHEIGKDLCDTVFIEMIREGKEIKELKELCAELIKVNEKHVKQDQSLIFFDKLYNKIKKEMKCT